MDESLAVLLLPGTLEGFALEAQARELLAIPRVVALEPSRLGSRRLVRNSASRRQARRLRFPGRVRLLVLYHPSQYLLARALLAEHDDVELWYIRPQAQTPALSEAEAAELEAFDAMAAEHATRTLPVRPEGGVDDASLRERLRELEVISPRAFVPDPGWRRKGSRRRR